MRHLQIETKQKFDELQDRKDYGISPPSGNENSEHGRRKDRQNKVS